MFFLLMHMTNLKKKEMKNNQKKLVETMQEVTALHKKLGLTDEDLYELSFDGTKYDYRFKEQTK